MRECPNCESTAVKLYGPKNSLLRHVRCYDCEMRGPKRLLVEEAIAKWNEFPRTGEDAIKMWNLHDRIPPARRDLVPLEANPLLALARLGRWALDRWDRYKDERPTDVRKAFADDIEDEAIDLGLLRFSDLPTDSKEWPVIETPAALALTNALPAREGGFPMTACKVGCKPICKTCGLRKNPIGRSAPLEMANSLCDHECEGYEDDPTPCDLWPGECRACFKGECKEHE